MAEKKKQHFVPQFYMRNFSADAEKKLFSLFHIGSGRRLDNIPIKGQNYEDYFYGAGNQIEDGLGLVEDAASELIGEILAGGAPPDRMSEESMVLAVFALFQSLRTPVAAKEANDEAEKLVKSLARNVPEWQEYVEDFCIEYENAPAEAISHVATVYPFMLDLSWKVMLNKTSRLFVTSDHPAIFYNQFLEKRKPNGSNLGLTAKGLQFFLPIGPNHLLMMFDQEVYRVGGRHHHEPIIEVSESDVIALNALQAANADELLFFSPPTDPGHIAESLAIGRPHHVEERASVTRHAVGDADGTGDLIVLSRVDPRIGLTLPSVGVLPYAAGPPLDNRAAQFRNPMFRQICREFCAEVEKGRFKPGDFVYSFQERFNLEEMQKGQLGQSRKPPRRLAAKHPPRV